MLNEKHMQTEAETKTEKCRIFYSWQILLNQEDYFRMKNNVLILI